MDWELILFIVGSVNALALSVVGWGIKVVKDSIKESKAKHEVLERRVTKLEVEVASQHSREIEQLKNIYTMLAELKIFVTDKFKEYDDRSRDLFEKYDLPLKKPQ